MSFDGSEYLASSPLLWTALVSLLVLTAESVLKKSEKVSFAISLLGLAVGVALVWNQYSFDTVSFFSMVRTNVFTNFFNLLFLFAAGFTIVLSRGYLERQGIRFGEFYCLVLMATVGMMLIGSAADLITVFLGIELMSVCLYVLAGFMRRHVKSNESALKYFLLGAFATGFLIYGIALVYGSAGTTNLDEIVNLFSPLSDSSLFWIGLGLILVGLGFKAAAVPFHMWVPDVYEGAPTPATAFMATGSKAAAFAGFLVVFGPLTAGSVRLSTVLALLAAGSMIVGNIIAVSQSNLKRMLAYSSIAHAGYILTGLAAGNDMGRQGIQFYLGVYTMMSIGAFGVLCAMEKNDEKHLSYDEYGGLSGRNPVMAALMAIFMFSLAGIPPFGGFLAKYYVFAAAVASDLTWLAIVGVLTSLVSVYYYLRLVVVMYFGQDVGREKEVASALSMAVLVAAAIAVIASGIFPSTLLAFTAQSF